MISVIVYGRNDVHGYNAHRRAALSLNCIAEVLTDADDEIVFVDYNSPDELPTLIEAIADTLTPRCRKLLRVYRVPASVHSARFRMQTHLPIVEPVARNVAARRANKANRWLLSTTTDMILVPRGSRTLSEICAELPDGYYGLPRFELPEWVWEQVPRSDPAVALVEIARLGPGLRLDETTVSHETIRFDAPGDFQLVLREDFFAIDGFDENMVLGWHVDSNLSKRLHLRRGSISSVEELIAGYHCNHSRIPTIYHGTEIANDLARFFLALADVDVPEQRDTWGMADVELARVDVVEGSQSEFTHAVLDAAESSKATRRLFDARDMKFALEYDSAHVLPFVADALSVAPAHPVVAYIGGNPALEERLAKLLASPPLSGHMLVAAHDNSESVELVVGQAELFVVDLGIDASVLDAPLYAGTGAEFETLRAMLARIFATFIRIVDLERERVSRGEHPRSFVLVNSGAVFWNAYIQAQLHSSQATFHARVRRSIVRAVPDESASAQLATERARRLLDWTVRRQSTVRHLAVRSGKTIELAELEDYGGFGEGWAVPDRAAIWTEGTRSELSLALDEAGDQWSTYLLRLSFDEIAAAPWEPLTVRVMANGTEIAAGELPPASLEAGHRLGLYDPSEVMSRNSIGRLRTWARSRGFTRIRLLRRLFFLALTLRAFLREITGQTADARPAPKLSWDIRVPEDVVMNGAVDLTLAIEAQKTELDDSEPLRALSLRSLMVKRIAVPESDPQRPPSRASDVQSSSGRTTPRH